MAKKKRLKLVRTSGYPPINAVMSKGYHHTEHMPVDYGMPVSSKELKRTPEPNAKRTTNVRELFSKKYR